MDDKQFLSLIALKRALLDWVEEARLDAIAIQCWSALQQSLGIMPCFADSELTGMGIPVVCETDVHGALTALLVQGATLGRTPISFSDLTIRHPENENSELLWHCGPFPQKLAVDDAKRYVSGHYILPTGEPGVCEWQIKGGDITIARFDGDHGEYSLLMGHTRGVEGPGNRGTYVWVEVDNWPRWEQRIIYGPYIHHVAGAHGKLAYILHEACRYLGVSPDPVNPNEEDISAYWRGEDL